MGVGPFTVSSGRLIRRIRGCLWFDGIGRCNYYYIILNNNNGLG